MSLVCDGRLLVRGWMKWVIYNEKRLVEPSNPEPIGRREKFELYILCNRMMMFVSIMCWKRI